MEKVVGSGKSRSHLIGRLLPIVLWLLPIIALNLGFSSLARIEFYWHEKLQHELARRELEALNAGAKIEYHLGPVMGGVFSARFPDSLVYAFHQKDLNSNASVSFANSDKIKTLRALALVFQHLVATNLSQDVPAAISRQRERLLQQPAIYISSVFPVKMKLRLI